MNLNFRHPEMTELRFNRKAKMWTIEQLHELWLRTCERHAKWKLTSHLCYDEIIKKIPKNADGEIIAYFKTEYYDDLMQYTFSYSSTFNSYAYHSSKVEFSKDIKKARDEKIDFIIANDIAYKLGQKYYDLQKYNSSHHWFVKKVMMDCIQDKLRKQFKDSDTKPPDVLIISISDKKYYLKVTDPHNYRYYEFELCNEVSDEFIKM